MIFHDFNVSVNMDIWETDPVSHRQFNGMTHCVTQLFGRLCPRIDTEKCAKLIVNVSPASHPLGKPTLIGNVFETYRHFDFPTFWKSTPLEQKRAILEALYSGAMEVAQSLSFSADVFTTTYTACLATNLTNEWFHHKSFRNSKLRGYSLRLFFSNDFEQIHVTGVVSKKEEEIARVPLFSVKQHNMYLHRALGKVTFVGNQIQVTSRNKEETWVATFEPLA